MRATRPAFYWIINILKKYRIPFQITGGLAARIYGATRPLADVDIDISEKHFNKILSDVKKYIVFGPSAYRDKNWHLLLVTLKYRGQLIDLCGAETAKIFNRNTGRWVRYSNAVSNWNIKKVYSQRVPVIRLQNLISYKSKLRRRVDLADLSELTGKGA